MTKPYKILSTRIEEHGTGVDFSITTINRVEHRDGSVDELPNITQFFVMVPPDQDVDTYLTDYLIQSGWNFE